MTKDQKLFDFELVDGVHERISFLPPRRLSIGANPGGTAFNKAQVQAPAALAEAQ
jgi:hypothetical protein